MSISIMWTVFWRGELRTSILSVGSGTRSSPGRLSFSAPSPGRPVRLRPGTFACGNASPVPPPAERVEWIVINGEPFNERG